MGEELRADAAQLAAIAVRAGWTVMVSHNTGDPDDDRPVVSMDAIRRRTDGLTDKVRVDWCDHQHITATSTQVGMGPNTAATSNTVVSMASARAQLAGPRP